MFLQKCGVSSHQFVWFFLHLKCDFANILVISFIFNFINSCFVFVLLLLILYLLILDFIHFDCEICKIYNFILFALKYVRFFYCCLLLRELFSYSVVWCGIVPEPTASALYLTRQHCRKTVLEGEDNNMFGT